VLGTLAIINLCSFGKPKALTFVSTTATLETDHYLHLSDQLVEEGRAGISEDDNLEGSRVGLKQGYGQSKWAAEQLIREASNRGLQSIIVRPGYITGDSLTGVSNTDDFVIRLLKGCAQLGLIPDINNTLNLAPVDYVARVVSNTVDYPRSQNFLVAQVTGQPKTRYNEFLSTLKTYGFDVKAADYVPWRIALEHHVTERSTNSLFPLLYFVLDNLPQNTKAPELSDTNTQSIIESSLVPYTGPKGVNTKVMGTYLAYLVGIGFLERPTCETSTPLPTLNISPDIIRNLSSVGGRGAKV
jgi:L-aminoadipate-semialdehyde dehydrogenase